MVVVAIETGGRWSDEAADFVWQMAQAKSREVPSFMNRSVALVWERRRTRVLSTVCAVSSAASLMEPCESDAWCNTDGEALSLAEVLSLDLR